jgi:hypothetical protein
MEIENGRQEMGGRRWETGDVNRRLETGDETGYDGRQEIGDQRQEKG